MSQRHTRLRARDRWMGQTKDLKVDPLGLGTSLSMHMIINSVCRHKARTRRKTHTHTHLPIAHTHTHQTTACTRTCGLWNWFWLVLPPVNPSGTGLPPCLSFSNNNGLTWTLLRARQVFAVIKDNLCHPCCCFSFPAARTLIITPHYCSRAADDHSRHVGGKWKFWFHLKHTAFLISLQRLRPVWYVL